MSVVVVVKKGPIVAIGSDTLTKLGSIKESAEYVENYSKIIRVDTSYIASVGPASGQQVLGSYFSGLKKSPVLSNPQSIFEEARKLQLALKEKYFLRPLEDDEFDEFESLRMSCLIANPMGIFGIYRLRAVQSYTKFYAIGSGCEFALGAMRAVYDRLESAEQIAAEGLAAAIDFDDGCGAPVEIKTVKLRKRRSK